MKTLLKNTLVGITLAAMTTGAIAATKSDELAEKIGTELIQEYMSQMEQFDPDPFLEALAQYGLPWEVKEL